MALTPTDNHKSGYIKIFRSLKSHWIWADAQKLKWWLDVLLSVNYSEQKILIKGQLVVCGRGQSVRSLDTWAKDWRTTKKTVQTFFRLLQSDEMILIENLKITTRITVCKYDSYNVLVNGDDYGQETDTTTQSKRSLPPNNKGNKDNKEKNIKPNGFIATEKQQISFDKFTEWIDSELPSVSKMALPFTIEQFVTLVGEMPDKNSITGYKAGIPKEKVIVYLQAIENNKTYLKKYRSPYLCVKAWYKKDKV